MREQLKNNILLYLEKHIYSHTFTLKRNTIHARRRLKYGTFRSFSLILKRDSVTVRVDKKVSTFLKFEHALPELLKHVGVYKEGDALYHLSVEGKGWLSSVRSTPQDSLYATAPTRDRAASFTEMQVQDISAYAQEVGLRVTIFLSPDVWTSEISLRKAE